MIFDLFMMFISLLLCLFAVYKGVTLSYKNWIAESEVKA